VRCPADSRAAVCTLAGRPSMFEGFAVRQNRPRLLLRSHPREFSQVAQRRGRSGPRRTGPHRGLGRVPLLLDGLVGERPRPVRHGKLVSRRGSGGADPHEPVRQVSQRPRPPGEVRHHRGPAGHVGQPHRGLRPGPDPGT
jgi:hypothetical protein